MRAAGLFYPTAIPDILGVARRRSSSPSGGAAIRLFEGLKWIPANIFCTSIRNSPIGTKSSVSRRWRSVLGVGGGRRSIGQSARQGGNTRIPLLRLNPHHMLKPYASFTQGLKAPDVFTYVKDLRVNYPANVAEDLLRTVHAEEKRLPGSIPAIAATAAVPIPSEEMFVNSNDAPRDLAPTAPPAVLPTPYDVRAHCADSRPQTLPLQAPVPTRSGPLVPPRPEPLDLARHARPSAPRHRSRVAAIHGRTVGPARLMAYGSTLSRDSGVGRRSRRLHVLTALSVHALMCMTMTVIGDGRRIDTDFGRRRVKTA